MIDITHKHSTLRYASATAVVEVSLENTIEAIRNRQVPKGDVLEAARVAGLIGVKKTSELIPDCHPLPIEYAAINYEIKGLEIHIIFDVKTIYKTGVEVEAMHGASIVALTMYDMLKPIDKGVVIRDIRLLEKKGGKSDFKDRFRDRLKAAVVVCSDTVAAGKKEDRAGKTIAEKLEAWEVEVFDYRVVPDEKEEIVRVVSELAREGINLILTTGGTGLSLRDVTPEAIAPLLDRQIPGIVEAARNYGQDRIPYAMLSRSVAGVIGDTLVITLPGSSNGARETMDALFPHVLHVFNILKGAKH